MGYHYDAFVFDPASAIESLESRVVSAGQVNMDAWTDLLLETRERLTSAGEAYLASLYVGIEDEYEVERDDEDLGRKFLCILAPWVESVPTISGRVVGLGLLEAFLVEQGWDESAATLVRGNELGDLVNALAAPPLRTAMRDWFPRAGTGWIPVEYSKRAIGRIEALDRLAPKMVSYDVYERVHDRPRGTDRGWFERYSGDFPALVDGAIAAAKTMLDCSIRAQKPLILGYGW